MKLTESRIANATIKTTQIGDGELSYLEGELTAPEPWKFCVRLSGSGSRKVGTLPCAFCGNGLASVSMRPQQDTYKGRTKYTAAFARNYQQVDSRKNEAERRLITKAFSHVPVCSVLDAPCGGGRVSVWLSKAGYSVTAGDLSENMLEIARKNFDQASLPIQTHRADVEALAFPDQSFDAIVCFRLFHHFPNRDIRQRVVAELCRVARRHVVVSYFSPLSFTSIKRSLQARLLKYPQAKFATSLHELRSYFQSHGFRFVRNYARQRFVHTLHIAVFEREASR